MQFRDAEQAPPFSAPPLRTCPLALALALAPVPSSKWGLFIIVRSHPPKLKVKLDGLPPKRSTLILWETFGVSGPPPVELAKPLRAFATRSANLFVAILSPANVGVRPIASLIFSPCA